MREGLAGWFDHKAENWQNRPVDFLISFVNDAEIFRPELDEGRTAILNEIRATLGSVGEEVPTEYSQQLFDQAIDGWEEMPLKQFRQAVRNAERLIEALPNDQPRINILNDMRQRMKIEEGIRLERLRVVRQAASRGISLTVDEVARRSIQLKETKHTRKTDKVATGLSSYAFTPPVETYRPSLAEVIENTRRGLGLINDAPASEETIDLEIKE